MKITQSFRRGSRRIVRGLNNAGVLTLCLVMALQPVMAELARAQDIIIDPSGNVGFAPTLKTTARPQVVDIARPNAGGVSHNQYSRFDVSPQGVVLNNAGGAVTTQLRGTISGNANLAGSPASTIVNEVRSVSGSSLRGPVEVAGQAAHVIVANPNGLLCDGCSFLNAGEATLTTGVPVVNGSAVRLDVTQGTVSVGRNGLDGAAGNLRNLNLIGRFVVVDGRVTVVDGLNVQAGAQAWDLTGRRRIGDLAATGSARDFAVDGTAFGAMEAGRITIVGNEAGFGVRALGALNATAQNVAVTSAGAVELRSAAARQAVTVNAPNADVRITRDLSSSTGSVSVAGRTTVALGADAGIYGATGVILQSTHGNLDVAGEVQSAAGIAMTAVRQSLRFAGYASADGLINFAARNDLTLSGATIVADRMNATGIGRETSLQDTAIFTNAAVTVGTAVFHLGRDVVVEGLTAATPSALVVAATGAFRNSADLRQHQSAQITYGGALINEATGIIAQDVLAIADRAVTNAGVMQGGTAVNLAVTSFTNTASGIVLGGNVTITSTTDLINLGAIVADADLRLTATTRIETSGEISAIRAWLTAPTITAQGTSALRARDVLTLAATTAITQQGEVGTVGDFTATTPIFSNTGLIMAQGALGVTGTSMTNHGTLISGGAIALNAVSGITNRGTMGGYGGLTLAVSGAGAAVDNRGRLQSDRILTVTGARFVNTGTDALVRAKTGAIRSSQIVNSGSIFLTDGFTRSLDIDLFDNSGVFASGGNIVVSGRDAASRLNLAATGVILAGLQPDDATQTLNTARGINLSFTNMTLAGQVAAGGSITLSGPTVLTLTGRVQANTGGISLTAPTINIGSQATIFAGGNGLLNATTLLRNDGAVSFGGRLDLAAGFGGFDNRGGFHAGSLRNFVLGAGFSNTGSVSVGVGAAITAATLSSTGHLQAGGTLTLTAAGALTLGGAVVSPQGLILSGGAITTVAGGAISATQMRVTGTSFTNRAAIALTGTGGNDWTLTQAFSTEGLVHAAGGINVSAATAHVVARALLASNGRVNLNASGATSVGGQITGTIIALQGGSVWAGSTSTLTATQFIAATATGFDVHLLGEAAVAGGITATAARNILTAGRVAGDTLTLTATGTVETRGEIYARQYIGVTAGGAVTNLGLVEARDAITVAGASMNNVGGARLASTDVILRATGGAVTNAGTLFGGRNVTVSGASFGNAATGRIEAGSLDLTMTAHANNSGLIDVVGLFANLGGAFNNWGGLNVATYMGVVAASFENAQIGNVTSNGHVYIRTTGTLSNAAGRSITANSMDFRGGALHNGGTLRATNTINVAEQVGFINNAANGTIHARTIALLAGTSFRNDGIIGQTASTALPRAETVHIASGTLATATATTTDNYGEIRGVNVRILSRGTFVNRMDAALQAGTLLAVSSTAGAVSNLGVMTGRDVVVMAHGVFDNRTLIRATEDVIIQASRIQNRDLDVVPSAIIEGKRIAMTATGDGIGQTGRVTGTVETRMLARAGDIRVDGVLAGPDIALVASAGSIWFPANLSSTGRFQAEGRVVSMTGTVAVTQAVTLRSTAYNVIANNRITTRDLRIEAARDVHTSAGSLRGSAVTQVVANDILRTDIADTNRKLASIGGATGDVFVQLRTGHLGALTETSTAGYEAAHFNVTGSIGIRADAGDVYLTGTYRAGKDVAIIAGRNAGFRTATITAAEVLHLEGRNTVKNHGALIFNAGQTVQISQENGWFYSNQWLGATVPFNLVVMARQIVLNTNHRIGLGNEIAQGRDLTLRATQDIAQWDSVISARSIRYAAGRDIRIDFDPFDWRAANPTANAAGGWWSVGAAGLRGTTLLSQGAGTEMVALRDIHLVSGKIHSGGSLSLTAVGNILSEPMYVESYEDSRPANVGWSFSSLYRAVLPGHTEAAVRLTELRAFENHLSAAGNVSLSAGGNIDLIGTQVTSSNGGITIHSHAGTITMLAAPGFWMYNHQTTSVRRSWLGLRRTVTTVTYDAYEDIYKPTTLTAANGNVEIVSAAPRSGDLNTIISAGTRITAQNMRISTLSTTNSTATGGSITLGTYAQESRVNTRTTSKSSFIGITYRNRTNTSARTALLNHGNDLIADDILTIASGNHLTIVSGSLTARRINVSAVGNLNILAAINSVRQSDYVERQNLITITTIQSGFDRQTAALPQIRSATPVTFQVGGDVHIAGAPGVSLNTQLLTVIGSRRFAETLAPLNSTQAAQTSTARAATLPDQFTREFVLPGATNGAQYAYLDTLIREHNASYSTILLRDHTWYDKQVRLTPAFQALLSIAVGYATGGLGLTAVQSAVANTLITGTIEGAITGNFDAGAILRNAALAGVASFVSNTINTAFRDNVLVNLSDASPFANGLGTQFSAQAIVGRASEQIINTVVSNVVHGRDPFADLDSLGRTFLVTEIMSVAQFGIGEMGHSNARWEGSLPHLILHGGLGCAAMEVMGGRCASGFFAGASQSVLAGSNLTDEQKLALAPLVGGLAGFLWAEGQAVGVSFGSTVARSGLQNNYLAHREREEVDRLRAELAEINARCAAQMLCSQADTARLNSIGARLAELQRLSVQNTSRMLQACSANPSSAACRAHITEASAYVTWQEGWFNQNQIFNVGVGLFYDPLLEDRAGGNLDRAIVNAWQAGQTGAQFLDAVGAQIDSSLVLWGGPRLRRIASLSDELRALNGGDGGVVDFCFDDGMCVPISRRDQIQGELARLGIVDFFVPMTPLGLATEIAMAGGGTLIFSGGRFLVRIGSNYRNATPDEIARAGGVSGGIGGGGTVQGIDGIWDQTRYTPFQCGNAIEDYLANTDYIGWTRVGSQNNGFSPAWDFNQGAIWVSLKTVDTTGSGWLPVMRAHINELQTWTSSNPNALRVLDIRVQPGGAAAAQPLINYGVTRGVQVRINEF